MIERFQLIQSICLYLGLISAVLAGLSAFGWNHYQRKIDEIKSIQQSSIDEKNKADIIDNVTRGDKEIIDFIDRKINQSYLKSNEYQIIRQKIEDLEKLVQGTNDPEEKIRYDIRLQEAIKELEIFKDDVVRLSEVLTKIEIPTDRINKAKKYIDQGKFKEANEVLDEQVLSGDLDGIKAMREESRKKFQEREIEYNKQLAQLSDEFLLKAKLVELEINNTKRLEMASINYKRSISISRNQNNLTQFAYFLNRNNHPDAMGVLLETLKYCQDNQVDPIITMNIQRTLGILYFSKFQFARAEEMFLEVIKAVKKLSTEITNSDRNYLMATIYTDIGNVYAIQGDATQAKVNYDASTSLLRKEFRSDVRIKNSLANNLMNCGTQNIYNLETSIRFLTESVELFRQLAKVDINHESDLAVALTNLGVLLKRSGDINAAKSLYREAFVIREKLYQSNPSVYGEDLAFTLNNLGNVLNVEGVEKNEAIKCLKMALEIRRNLSFLDPEKFSYQVAQTQYNISLFYARIGDIKNAIIAIDEVIKILKPIRNKTPELKERYDDSIKLRKSYMNASK